MGIYLCPRESARPRRAAPRIKSRGARKFRAILDLGVIRKLGWKNSAGRPTSRDDVCAIPPIWIYQIYNAVVPRQSVSARTRVYVRVQRNLVSRSNIRKITDRRTRDFYEGLDVFNRKSRGRSENGISFSALIT